MDERFRELARLATKKYGLCTSAELVAVGFSRREVARLIRIGQFERVASGVIRIAGTPMPWQARILAEQLSVGDDALASHRSAACLYGLRDFDPGRVIHLTTPAHRRPRKRDNVIFHRSSDYDLAGVRRAQGVRVTGVPRLILDLCATERNLAIPRRALHSARKKHLVTWGALGDALEGHARKGRDGIETFRWLLERFSGKGSPESGFEDILFDHIVGAGLPEPILQYRTVAGGRRFRLDLVYETERVLIECKGRKDHLTDEAFENDPVRENALNLQGWTVLVFTWLRFITDPEGILAEIGQALAQSPARAPKRAG
jgi:very-short-patch-repair endonuclease